jgi:phosphoglycerate dehydrogenase-like enzyme
MKALGHRRRDLPSPDPSIELAASMAELLERSDHVVVAAPGTASTHHLINAQTLAAMKPGAHLINVARGSLVDQDALIAALDSGHLSLASLDVTDPEPLPEGHVLYSHPLVRLSPHISWSSPTTVQRTVGCFIDNIGRFRAGQPLEGVVDRIAGY